jgi:hypothetical protein
MKVDEKQNWALVSPSGIAFYFGNFSKQRLNKFNVSLSELPKCLFGCCILYNLSGFA